MPTPQNRKDETILITLRMPKSLLEAIDKAVELGYFPSRSEALREGLKWILRALVFSIGRYEIFTDEKKDFLIPPDVYYLIKAIANIHDIRDPFFDYYFGMVDHTASLLRTGKKEDLKELLKILEEVLE